VNFSNDDTIYIMVTQFFVFATAFIGFVQSRINAKNLKEAKTTALVTSKKVDDTATAVAKTQAVTDVIANRVNGHLDRLTALVEKQSGANT